jgi:hypothetical protein
MKARHGIITLLALAFLAGSAWGQTDAVSKINQGAKEMEQGAQQGVQEGTQKAKQTTSRDWTSLFDKKNIETITGDVVEAETIKSTLGVTKDLHIYVRTDKEKLPVVLGPEKYLDTQNVTILKGDRVEVTGSRVMVKNQPTIIAEKVKKGDQTLELRDNKGQPKWSGQGR